MEANWRENGPRRPEVYKWTGNEKSDMRSDGELAVAMPSYHYAHRLPVGELRQLR